MLTLTRRRAGAIAGASILLPRFAKAAEINWKFTSSQAATHPLDDPLHRSSGAG